MPKTAKKGFTYFRFETDHFYDPKVKRLKNKFGMEGWGVFHFIVNEIFRVEGCYMVMDADGLFDIADYSRMDECRIAAIIDYCTDLGLFDKRLWQEKQILTSKYIQELYTDICKAIHRRPAIPGELLLYSPENLQETVPASYPVPEERASTMEANVSVLSEKRRLPDRNLPIPIRYRLQEYHMRFFAKKLKYFAKINHKIKTKKTYPPQTPQTFLREIRMRRIFFQGSSKAWAYPRTISGGYIS